MRSRHVNPLPLEPELASMRARYIEQVAYQARHVPHLSLDDALAPEAAAPRPREPRSSIAAALRMGVSGLRNSCATTASTSICRPAPVRRRPAALER